MKIIASGPEEYIAQLPDDRREVMTQLRKTILDNLPDGFAETMSYGMIGYVVPHAVYPQGYHCDTSQPLPFMSIASQKNHVAVYHMGLYADKDLMDWFLSEFPNHSKLKPDLGKSCIRFRKMNDVPYSLLGKLAGKMSAIEWISLYEKQIKG